MTHTKGPWKFVRLSWGCQVISGPQVIVAIDTDGMDFPQKIISERISNARLIAAAPTMAEKGNHAVEALYAAYMQFMPAVGHGDEMEMIMKAVNEWREVYARATGEQS
jgi:tartrate dehydratase beta subunit/fumarate hydratase class I family protein